MFTDFLYLLRAQGLKIGTGDWVGFLDALKKGLATDTAQLYIIGRALLCRTEADFDKFDLAFAAAFKGATLPDDLRRKLEEWLANAAAVNPNAPPPKPVPQEDLWDELRKRLKEQKERHDGGNHWVGTGGTSPFGNSGAPNAPPGIRLGGSGQRGGAVAVAQERQWESYRTDRVLDVRDMQVALRAVRSLKREGRLELDLDETIDKTAKNAGDIEVIERPERKNQVHVVLLMDTGGSMQPHVEKVERLFTAASRIKTFKTFKSYAFHNCVYDKLYLDIESGKRIPTAKVLAGLTARHRLVFVGDAAMAPYELFSPFGWPGEGQLAGYDWLRRIHERCPASIWLNPDPPRWWSHPTVSAIGKLFPMYELTLDGLRDAVKKLRAPT